MTEEKWRRVAQRLASEAEAFGTEGAPVCPWCAARTPTEETGDLHAKNCALFDYLEVSGTELGASLAELRAIYCRRQEPR